MNSSSNRRDHKEPIMTLPEKTSRNRPACVERRSGHA
jgi:hypothetical protein